MFKWVLILAINGQQGFKSGYETQEACIKAATAFVENGHRDGNRTRAACYELKAVLSWVGK